MTPAEYEQKQPGDFDVIIFDRYAPQAAAAVGQLHLLRRCPAGLEAQAGDGRTGSTVMLTRGRHPRLEARPPDCCATCRSRSSTPPRRSKLDVPLDSEVLIEGMKGPLRRAAPRRPRRAPGRRVRPDAEQLAAAAELPDLPAQRASVHGAGQRHGRAAELRARRHAARSARQPPTARATDGHAASASA